MINEKKNALQVPLCAAGELGGAVNVRTLTTHIGFVKMAVTAPLQRGGKTSRSARIGRIERQELRTRFGGIEEILGGREGSVGCSERRATLELIVAIIEREREARNVRIENEWN